MANNRASTDVLKRQGARQKAVDIRGRISNVFEASLGTDSAIEATNKLLGSEDLVPNEVNVEHYHVAKSFFNTRTDSESAAITLALLSLDAAKVANISVMKFLNALATDSEITFDTQTLVTLNTFRPITSKASLMTKNTNKNSLRSRSLLP